MRGFSRGIGQCAMWLCLAVSLLPLAGCKEAVYTKLSQRDANDVLLTLLQGGVDAEKRGADGKSFSVWVPESKMATSIELLQAAGEPPRHYANLGEIFAQKGLVSSPRQERARFIFGLEQELDETLSQIDGVLVARVQIVLPNNDPLAVKTKPASASVFLKYRADVNMQVVVPEVKDLVVRSVQGLSADRVAVTLFPAQSTLTAPNEAPVARFFGALVAASSVPRLSLILGLPWLVVAILVLLLLNAVKIRGFLAELLRQRHTATLPPAEAYDDEDMNVAGDRRAG